jgi:8-oxo-dGTP pyrophosphatase MutT (NUDIX family)
VPCVPASEPPATSWSGRRAGRVVLVDPAGAVLLLAGRDPGVDGAPEFWFVPGGGAEAAETIEEAARREVFEEVGAELGDLGPVAWTRRVSFPFDGGWFDQSECFYVVRTTTFIPRATALTELERRSTTGARWWPLAELAGTSQAVHPPRLAMLVRDWLLSGPPGQPIEID